MLQSERTLKDAGDKVSDDIKKPVQEKIDALKKLLENKEAKNEDIKKSYDELSAEIQKVGTAMYQAAGAGGPQSAPGGGPDAGTPGPDAGAGSAPNPDDEGVKVKKQVPNEGPDDAVEGEVVDKKE